MLDRREGGARPRRRRELRWGLEGLEMRPLSAHREEWDERRRLEALYREFGRHLEEVEPDLQQERARDLSMLQGRLGRSGQVQKEGAA